MVYLGAKAGYMNIDYSKQTLETPNPIARFAHTKRYQVSLRTILNYLEDDGALLDFGCGKGDLLDRLSDLKPQSTLYGFDPESNHTPSRYLSLSNLNNVLDESIDIVCCFETLEHLLQSEKGEFYKDVNRILEKRGKLVVSVPIIGGSTLLLKELNHIILFKRKTEYSVKELVLATFLGKPAKQPENPRVTHKGFDFRELEKELSFNFQILEKSYSPFPFLPWYFNSQVFYILSKLS
jgi:2-polyprenyl-3-methyl-5-hydroxy-6-metoxy-1,4-benzoquinol methylase